MLANNIQLALNTIIIIHGSNLACTCVNISWNMNISLALGLVALLEVLIAICKGTIINVKYSKYTISILTYLRMTNLLLINIYCR